jgi:2-amino-4-hydroxy-6-hydroxymethyldihydropteridine diphosphokinase
LQNGTTGEEVIAYIGLGSNMNGALEPCREAVRRLGSTEGIAVLRASSWYRTEPVGFRGQEWFINAVVEVRTALSAHALLQALQTVENAMGRVRAEKWGPRIIDLDILLFGENVIDGVDLTVPHPELHRRRFVLVPLCELAAEAIHPTVGVSMRTLLSRLDDTSKVERI